MLARCRRSREQADVASRCSATAVTSSMKHGGTGRASESLVGIISGGGGVASSGDSWGRCGRSGGVSAVLAIAQPKALHRIGTPLKAKSHSSERRQSQERLAGVTCKNIAESVPRCLSDLGIRYSVFGIRYSRAVQGQSSTTFELGNTTCETTHGRQWVRRWNRTAQQGVRNVTHPLTATDDSEWTTGINDERKAKDRTGQPPHCKGDSDNADHTDDVSNAGTNRE